MHRSDIIDSIRHYQTFLASGKQPHKSFRLEEELDIINKFMMFIESTPDCFDRTCAAGHITGSAMVVSQNFENVLLTLHGKLNKWLQLGGHSDGNSRTHEVSLREVEEESGVQPIKIFEPMRFLSDAVDLPSRPLPFDFDYHFIPARKTEPEHIHYDVRYIVMADDRIPPVMSDESHDLKWMPITAARGVTDERSMHRQFDKIDYFRSLFSH